jgi:hypothetical protein
MMQLDIDNRRPWAIEHQVSGQEKPARIEDRSRHHRAHT